MGVYDEEIAVAQELIAEFGGVNTWNERITPASVDSDNPHIPGNPVVTAYTVRIAWLPWDQEARATFTRLTGLDNPGDGYLYGLMGAVAFTPTTTAQITLPEGGIVKCTALDRLAPNGEIVLWTVFAEL